MSSISDYLLWRGDLSLHSAPWTPVDGLIMACLCYNELPAEAVRAQGVALRAVPETIDPLPADSWQFLARCRELLISAADTLRFGDVRLHDYVNVVDEERQIQFSAVTADLPDGSVCVCFRGTDSSIVGWREDFTMAFESPVPAQMEALTYLERTALRTKGDVILTGHSKGGNLSLYAAAHADPATQARIRSVYSFDGPGVDEATLHGEGYGRIRSRVHSFIPQSSVVGVLLSYHPEYTVVRAKALSLLQHDAFTWQLSGPRFEELGEVDAGSQLVDETVREWLTQATPQQRELFVDTLFDLLESTGAQTFQDLKTDVLRHGLSIISATRDLDPQTLMMIGRLIGRFVTIGLGNIRDAVIEKLRGEPTQEE